jgi:hypothetical protein
MMLRILVVLALTVLAGCSRTELVYRNADWLLERYAGKTLDANREQREQWRPVLTGVLAQHRDQVLPVAVGLLDEWLQAVEAGDRTVSAECLLDGTLELYRMHALLAVDLAAPLLAELQPSQIQHFADYLADRQSELREVYFAVEPEQRHAARLERFTERTERWTGPLTDMQRRIVGAASERIPDLSGQWLAYRQQQSRELLRLLEAKAGEARLRTQLTHWWVDWDGRSQGYQARWVIARHEFSRFLEDLRVSLTDTQRRSVQRRVISLREELASLYEKSRRPLAEARPPIQCTT